MKAPKGRKYLVIVRAGDFSLHEQWLQPVEHKNFDIFVSYYGDQSGRFADRCDRYEERKGTKFAGVLQWVQELGKQIHRYDAVWLPDDDIVTDAYNIHRMFKLFADNQLHLAHPAMTKNASQQATIKHIDYLLRYTPYVEAIAPVFSRDALQKCLHTFGSNDIQGIERIWPKLLETEHKKIAILDAAAVKRTRPQGLGEQYVDASPGPEQMAYADGIKVWDPIADLMPPIFPALKSRKRRIRKLGSKKRRRAVSAKNRPTRLQRRTIRRRKGRAINRKTKARTMKRTRLGRKLR